MKPTNPRSKFKKSFLLTILVLMTLLTACAPTPAGKLLVSQNGIEIYQATIRLPGDDMSGKVSNTAVLAGYIVIKNTGSTGDSLINVQADFARMTMLHESFVDNNGVASMNMVAAINVPAGQMVELKPGGFHVMFVGLKQDLKVGDKVTLVLQFQQAGAIRVQAEVTDR